MAWRDSRKSRARLLLFAASIAAGVAAVAAVGSFSADLQRAVDDQARTLVGADIAVQSRRPFTTEDESLFRSLGSAVSHEVRFVSMALFPRSQGTRLVQVRAAEGAFPFYGRLETEPAAAEGALRAGNAALADESLLLQFGEKPGCEMKLGDATFSVAGGLRKAPGESFAISTLAPRVYIPLKRLAKTGLLRRGSLASYFAYLKLDDPGRIPAAVKQLEARGFACDTVAKRKKDLGREMENLYHFLNITGFVALLLGATAVAGAIHLHVRSRVRSVALLRCLGCSSAQALAIYLIQTMALAVFGSLAGVLAGVAVQAGLPKILADFLPVRIGFGLSFPSILTGLMTGIVFCWLFAMLPLLSLRRVSPLSALRAPDLSEATPDPLRWVFHGLAAAGVTAFAVLQTGNWRYGLSLAAALAGVLAILLLVARGIVFTAHKYLRSGWPYVWRQGLSNLYRPGNRTVLLMLSLGLGTFLVLTIFFAQRMLLGNLTTGGPQEANIILFDIGAEQLDGLSSLLHRLGAPMLERVPMVPMRLEAVKGRSIQQLRSDPKKHIREWVLDRDYRSSYRDHLSPTETVVQGRFTGEWTAEKGPAPISVEEGIAKDLDVTVGDPIAFDVQGVKIDTVVGSIRKVDWKRFRTNFFIIFPKGILEDAPGTFIALSRAAGNEQSATLQREIVRQYPGISVLDLQAIVSSVDAVLAKVAFVIRFMSLFTLLTGVMILAAALFSSRYERAREEALLRVLGATSRQVFSILVIEFALLGFFAAVTGIVLSVGAAYGLAFFVFKVRFVPRLVVALPAIAVMMAITVGAGLAISRQDGKRTPLALLAEE